MRLTFLQFVDPRLTAPAPIFSQSTAVLAASLKQGGFDCKLVAMPGFQPAALHAAMAATDPQAVLVQITSRCKTAAHRTISEIAQSGRPVVAYGPFATTQPQAAISIPGVAAVLLGECEGQAAGVLTAIVAGKEPSSQDGAWVRGKGGMVRGAMAPLKDNLDELPFADRDLFGCGASGKPQRTACFRASRGCRHWCSHCLNYRLADLYADKGAYVRRRSASNLIAEIEKVRADSPGLARAAFDDHCFGEDPQWLADFCEQYAARVRLPFTCRMQPPDVTEESARRLAAAGCQEVRLHVGSGSKFIRQEILTMAVDNKQIAEAGQMLRHCGIRAAAWVLVGSPYESEITIDDTLRLLERAGVERVKASVFMPVDGTRAAEICRENGWVSGRSEESAWAGRSVLDMPSMSAEAIERAARRLASYGRGGAMRGIKSFFGKLGSALHRSIF